MIITVDDFVPNFEEILEESKGNLFSDIPYGGGVFPSISPGVRPWAYLLFETHLGFPVVPVIDYLRKYYKGVPQPSYIHEDSAIAKYTAVLSMRDDNGGLAFWLHDTVFKEIEFKKNRCVIYDASIFHSRTPEHWDQDEPRFVHVFFFNPKEAA